MRYPILSIIACLLLSGAAAELVSSPAKQPEANGPVPDDPKVFLEAIQKALEQQVPDGSPADKAWDELQKHFLRGVMSGLIDEPFRRKYRDLGVKFWDEFPQDPRRTAWLRQSMNIPPRYLADPAQAARMDADNTPELAKIDEPARAAWLARYAKMRSEYLQAFEKDPRARGDLLFFEIQERLMEAKYALRRGEDPRFGQQVQSVVDFAAEFPERTGSEGPGSLAAGFMDTAVWHVKLEEFTQALERMRKSPSAALRRLAEGKVQMAELRSQPMQLNLTTLDGAKVDLAQLRGKVVLVDFWSLGCSSCLEAMPRIKTVYDRYRQQGFEVIGVAFEDEQKSSKVKAELKKRGIDWPQSLQGNVGSSALWKRFGFTYVPVTFLLDKNGQLVTTDIDAARGPKLEREVRRLLGLAG